MVKSYIIAHLKNCEFYKQGDTMHKNRRFIVEITLGDITFKRCPPQCRYLYGYNDLDHTSVHFKSKPEVVLRAIIQRFASHKIEATMADGM